ncbi:MAG TPA: copper-binding protein [Porticoccus sp.]|nr:copper-binding protein [Porticoccus sp.]
MSTKSIFISMLLTGAVAGAAFAGGPEGHDHGRQAEDNHKMEDMDHKVEGMDHSTMPGRDHNDGHQHDNEGSSVGEPALAVQATQTIHVTTMDTMRYKFSPQPELKAGDIVKFVITNQGKIPHEFSIGDDSEQKAHREMMRKMPNMVHEDGNTVTIKPGETKELTWKFKSGSDVFFACNIPGHFEAGMFVKTRVSALDHH